MGEIMKIPAAAVAAQETELQDRVARMEAVLLEQNALLRQLVQAVGEQRITRAQEGVLKLAIRRRAREICQRELLPGRAERIMAAAIRTTIREATGCRAVGDLPSRQFDAVRALVIGWDMTGAIRRIRRECNG